VKAVVLAARVILAVVFLFAGAIKGMDPHHAAVTVGSFQMTPPELSLILGVMLPGMEIFAGAALLTGFYVRGATLLILGMSVMFMAAVSSVMWRGLDIDCGCFGDLPISPRAGWETLSIDAGILILAVLLLVGTRRQASSPGP
jgi:putative oxidoreductase